METEIAHIDFEKILKERFPDKKISNLLIKLVKKVAHEDDINDIYLHVPAKGMKFLDGSMNYFKISSDIYGKENLPKDNRSLIFPSNHPLGSLDAMFIAHVLGKEYNGKIKIYANEILTLLEPLKEVFLPIYKYCNQGRENIQKIRNFFESDEHLLTFPAGATSRKYGDKIIDLEWQKNFVQKAVEYHRDVVPLYLDAHLSNRFYRVEHFRERIHSKINFEMAMLASELFKQKGSHYKLYIGKPIPWQTFDKSKTQKEWAAWVKEIVYQLPEKNYKLSV